MTKSVAGMLAYKVLMANNVPLDTKVVDSFKPGRAPSWVADWQQDDRSQITIRELFNMTDGLAKHRGLHPAGRHGANAQRRAGHGQLRRQRQAGIPAGHALELHQPDRQHPGGGGARTVRQRPGVLGLPDHRPVEPIGANSATLETDTDGTWVGSSHLGDAVRLGQVRPTRVEGRAWDGKQVLPAGWWQFASTSALPTGDGAGYSAQTWLPYNRRRRMSEHPGVPADTVAMEGHWGEDRHGAVQAGSDRATRLDLRQHPIPATASSSRTCSRLCPTPRPSERARRLSTSADLPARVRVA